MGYLASYDEADYRDEVGPHDEVDSLEDTPEALGYTPLKETGDQRDLTPDPPALLNPRSVLRNRRRAQIFLASGRFTWPRPV